MTTLPAAPDVFHVFDTTLRDGAQQEGLQLSVIDKLKIARHLDELGVGFIEGGWPGANPNDTAFFAAAAAGQLELKQRQAGRVRSHPSGRGEGCRGSTGTGAAGRRAPR